MSEREDTRLSDDRDETPVSLLEEILEKPTEQRLLLEGGDGEPEEPPEQQVHCEAARCVRRDGRRGVGTDLPNRSESGEKRSEGERASEGGGEHEDDTGDAPEEVAAESLPVEPPPPEVDAHPAREAEVD